MKPVLTIFFITVFATFRVHSEMPAISEAMPADSLAHKEYCQKTPIRRRATASPPSTALSNNQIQEFNIYCDAYVPENAASAPDKEPKDPYKWIKYLTELIKAIAWPIVAIAITWRLGPELGKKIPSLKKFKAGPVEAEFMEEIEALRKDAEARLPETAQPKTVSSEEARLLELARVSPRSAIIEAWRSVEVAATNAIQERTPPVTTHEISYRQTRPKSGIALARELGLLQILNFEQQSVFNELRQLRNQAAHIEDFETNFESANNYIQLCEVLRETIRSAMLEHK